MILLCTRRSRYRLDEFFLIDSSVDEHDNNNSQLNASAVSSTISRFGWHVEQVEKKKLSTAKIRHEELSTTFPSPANWGRVMQSRQ
jgi:hypothetical protein